jgi:hypothetical protein
MVTRAQPLQERRSTRRTRVQPEPIRLLDVALTGVLLATVKNEGKEVPLKDRRRYCAALHLICEHLRAIGVPKLAVDELRDLIRGLRELDRGIVWPFLQSAKSGSKVSPANIWRARAYVAIAASLLVTGGEDRKAACDTLAKDYAFLQPYIAGKNTKKFDGAIRSWLDRFEKQAVKHRAAQEIFNERGALAERWAVGKDLGSKPAAALAPTQL